MEELQNQVGVVTGASSGIGRATALALAAAGTHVVLVARRRDRLEQLATEIDGLGNGARTAIVDTDITASDAADRCIAASAELGAWSLLVNNAGLDGQGASIEDLDLDQVRRLFDANVIVPMRLAQALSASGSGRAIVNVSSINGKTAEEHFADYNASKAALISLTQSMAIDLAPKGIRVNAVCPGYTATEMTASYLADSATRSRIEDAIPLRRVGQAEEIADVIAFLLSGHASYITGEAITVDGGRTAGWVGSA